MKTHSKIDSHQSDLGHVARLVPKVVTNYPSRSLETAAKAKRLTSQRQPFFGASSKQPLTIFVQAGEQASWLLPLASCVTLLAGTTNMLLIKWSGRHVEYQCGNVHELKCQPSRFHAPYAQQACNCLGQAICLLLHVCDQWVARYRNKGRGWLARLTNCPKQNIESRPNLYIWILPALCDFLSSILIFHALYVSSASNVQLLRNFNLVVCAALSVCWLKSSLRIFHWLGITLMCVGFIFTAVDSAVNPQENAGSRRQWLGTLLSLVGTSLSAFQLVFEERLFRKFSCTPFEAVGWVGTYETVLTAIAIIIAHVGGLEDAAVSAYQAFHNAHIFTALALFVVSVALFTTFGVATTQVDSAMLTATLFASRQVLIWITEISLKWTKFSWLALLGTIFVLAGFFIYNHLVPRQFCGWYDDFALREWRWECVCFCADASTSEAFSNLSDDDFMRDDEAAIQTSRVTSSVSSHINDKAQVTPFKSRATIVVVAGGPGSVNDEKMRPWKDTDAWIYVEKERKIPDR